MSEEVAGLDTREHGGMLEVWSLVFGYGHRPAGGAWADAAAAWKCETAEKHWWKAGALALVSVPCEVRLKV